MLPGDSRFFEESINAGKLRALLDGRSHNAASGLKDRTQAMKWLLAMISKGRDVSQFYPDVVKNVIVKSVELKKLVYVYLIHYTDHDATCRELALLSINSFQKDLADRNPLIRALALRTMTSIRVRDIIQLQLMAVKKCAFDGSAYVRKTAAHALPKIFSLDRSLQAELIELTAKLLTDRSTMVLGSVMAAFNEVAPDQLPLLHPHFRRLCSSLADLDEWGQIQTLSILSRYARAFFVRPMLEDRAARPASATLSLAAEPSAHSATAGARAVRQLSTEFRQLSEPLRELPTANELKSFYGESDDEDAGKGGESASGRSRVSSGSAANQHRGPQTAKLSSGGPQTAKPSSGGVESPAAEAQAAGYHEMPRSHKSKDSSHVRSAVLSRAESSDMSLGAMDGAAMEPDHKALLRACLPLLSSRNSGVVLGAVAMLWSCGRRSRTAMTRSAAALVRHLRGAREVQYLVLNAILPMAAEYPEYFQPHIADFFVNAPTDARFVRYLKCDILTLLVSKDNVDIVLAEFEEYLAHPDKKFVRCATRAVGRIVNQLPHLSERVLRGLMTLMTSENEQVVAEAVVVTRTLLQQREPSPAVVRRIVRLFDRATVPAARASVVWIASEFVSLVPEMSPEMLRKLVANFSAEQTAVKVQVINLATRLNIVLETSDEFHRRLGSQAAARVATVVKGLLQYALELARFDEDYDLRDRVRFIAAVLERDELGANRHKILMEMKPPPSVQKIESKYSADPTGRFALDSLSHCVGHPAFGYQPLLDWPTQESRPNLRDPAPAASRSASSGRAMTTARAVTGPDDFYKESEQNGNLSDTSESSSSSSSSSSGNSESGQAWQGTGRARAASASSSSDEDSSGRSSSDEADSDGDTDSSGSSDVESVSSSGTENSIGDGTEAPLSQAKSLATFDSYVLTPGKHVTTVPASSGDSISTDALLFPVHDSLPLRFAKVVSSVNGGGIEVDVAFKRRSQEAGGPRSNHVLLRLTNTRPQAVTDVRLTHEKLVAGQALVPFAPIPLLAPKESRVVEIDIDFDGKPNQACRFSLTSDRGSFPVAIEAPCGELTVPAPQLLESAAFAALESRMSGMHSAERAFSGEDAAALEAAGTQALADALMASAHMAVVVSSDGKSVRGAARKLASADAVVIVVATARLLRVGCEEFIFGPNLLEELAGSIVAAVAGRLPPQPE